MKIRQSGRPISLDRFIIKRSIYDFDTDENIIDHDQFDNEKSVDESLYYINTARERFFQNNYRSMLKNIMFLNKSISRDIFWNENVDLKPHEIIKHWPVEARRHPLLSNSPAVFLDLPDLDTHFCKNIVDWGNTGYIATIFDSKVHLWHPDKKVTIKVSTEFYDNTVERCIRWNRDGSLFAVAVNINQVAVYDILGNKAIAWHPWKDSLLVLGETDHFFLWNVQNQKVSCSVIFPNTYIDSLIFNPMSAELLVSQHLYDEDGNIVSYLRVMKNLNCIVDEVRCNACRIPYLMWDPTATKLGTASTEENFCIWDFFGRGTKQEKKYKNTKRGVYANDIFKNNVAFGSVIR
ncbi:uncharacterized protein [Diabrotica undecimpunctata]|uniref:uncharacterized protein isoform X2 n=1 Tax=Diabrotica undecimpunctata TaxID=50387 RepID=UPI003B639AFC